MVRDGFLDWVCEWEQLRFALNWNCAKTDLDEYLGEMVEVAPAEHPEKNQALKSPGRRTFLSVASIVAMVAGLVGGYGALAAIAGRFLYPTRSHSKNWLFVTQVHHMKGGDNMLYRLPSGETVNITRQSDSGSAEDFIALSSICPHLGCRVHWESHNSRYFCPCHNGAFDPAGKGISGPPGEAGQALSRYQLKIEKQLLFLEGPPTSSGYASYAGGEGAITGNKRT